GKRKRAIAHAPARPKIRFSTTATGATMSVSLIECSVSGSCTRLSQYAVRPAEKASTNTTTSGITTRKTMIATGVPMSSRRTMGGSSCARRWAAEATAGSAMVARAPSFDEVDAEERDERDQQQDDGDRGRLGVVELLEPRDHEDRRDLGLERHVAGDEDDRAVLPERAREREGEPRDDRRRDRGQDHPPHGLEAVRPEARRRLLHVALEALEYGLQRADDEREADEDHDEAHADSRDP